MSRLGADPDDLDLIAQRLDSAGGLLHGARGDLGSRLRSTAWTGPAADQFRTWWSRKGSADLDSAGNFMTYLVGQLRDEAVQQRWASSGANVQLTWPGRPPHWSDPVTPGLRRGPSGSGPFGDSGSGAQGDPVDTATGALWFEEHDLDLVSPGGFRLPLTRFHHSWYGEDLSFGPGWVSLFDTRLYRSGDEVGVIVPDGSFLQFTAGGGRFGAAAGVTAGLAVRGAGHVLSDTEGRRWVFDAAGDLVAVEAVGDLGFSLQRDANGRVVSIGGLRGGPAAVTWDGDGHVATVVTTDGEASFRYDDTGHLVGATNRSGEATYRWDDRHRVVEQWDRRGRLVVSTEYGDDGRVVRQHDPRGELYRYRWDATTGRAVMTDPLGAEWTDRYVGGLLVERMNPMGGGIRITRRGAAAASVASLDGTVLATGPDDGGQGAGDGSASGLETDGEGRPLRWAGMELVYDSQGLLAGARLDADRVLRLERDPAEPGRITAVDDGAGHRAQYRYDDGGRLIGVVGLNAEASYTYDDDGQLASVEIVTAEGRARLWREDGALWREADGQRSLLAEADEYDRLTASVDGLGRPTRYAYDEWDRLVGVTGPGGAVTAYTYDVFDRVAARTDPLGRSLHVTRDAAQRLTGLVTEDGMAYELDLDPTGRLTGLRDGAGRELRIERDEAGDVVRLVGTGVATAVGYDDQRRPVEIATDANSIGVRYDGDQVAGLTTGDGRLLAYEYAPSGAVTAKIVDGVRIDIAYLGGLEGRYTGPAGVAELVPVGDDSLVLVLPNGLRSTATWTDGRLAALAVDGAGAAVLDERYEVDGAGNVTATHRPDGTWRYGYDERDMITAAAFDGPEPHAVDWAYDQVGTRLRATYDGVIERSVLDDRARIVAVERDGEPIRAIAYDDAGKVIADGGWAFEHDVEGRLRRAVRGTTEVVHDVDGLGHRVRTVVTEAGTVTRDVSMVWDVSTELAEPVLAVDNLSGERYLYQHGPMGAPLGVVPLAAPERARWFLTDAYGTVRAVTDGAGEVLGGREYDPFGRVLRQWGDMDTGPLSLGFLGAIEDPETGLTHLRAREYDPSLGRFLSPDPVLIPVGAPVVTGYAYAFNRPTALADPSGLWPGEGALNSVTSTVGSALDRASDLGADLVDEASNVVDEAADLAVSAYHSSAPTVAKAIRQVTDYTNPGLSWVSDLAYEHRHGFSEFLDHAELAATVAVVVAAPLTDGASLLLLPAIGEASAAGHGVIAFGALRAGDNGTALKQVALAGISLLPGLFDDVIKDARLAMNGAGFLKAVKQLPKVIGAVAGNELFGDALKSGINEIEELFTGPKGRDFPLLWTR
ncbi:MAG: RHS repeat-associated core domain-containing protein [Acidimicrobiales bacterium]